MKENVPAKRDCLHKTKDSLGLSIFSGFQIFPVVLCLKSAPE